MNVLVPVGTRPEIIKLAPVIHRLRADGHHVRVVATGQHFDANLTDVFYQQLGFEPDEQWQLADSESERLAEILRRGLEEMVTHQPDLLLVVGDTWTVPLLCLAARRHQVPIAHLEAGLRSFNPTSMEEVNRRVAGASAQLHFAPTETAAAFLRAEGIEPERIFVVGNPVLDVLRTFGTKRAARETRRGVTMTAHRPTNVDDPERLTRLVTLAERLMVIAPPVVFPLHPRTRQRLHDFDLWSRLNASGVTLLDPLPYDGMLDQLSRSLVVVTDSGGVQEEAAWLGLPVVVLRRSTPRWEGVDAGTSVLCGLDIDQGVAAVARFCTEQQQEQVAATACRYGDGYTANHVARILAAPETLPLLALDEPDFVGQPVPQGRA